MGGHRKRRGDQLRSKNRNQVWRGRIERAPTAEQQLAVAVDWLRSSAHNFPDPDVRERVLHEAASWLGERADELDHKLITAATPYHRSGVYPEGRPMTDHERPPLHLPRRPSKRRRDLRNRLVHADERARAPARPERGSYEYATVGGARRKLSFRGGLALIPAADYLTRQPPSLAQRWEHRKHVSGLLWRVEKPAPGQQPPQQQQLLLADGQLPALAPQQPSWSGKYTSPAGRWLYWLGMAWGAAHLGLCALAYLVSWVTFSPRRLIAAAVIWLVFWVIL